MCRRDRTWLARLHQFGNVCPKRYVRQAASRNAGGPNRLYGHCALHLRDGKGRRPRRIHERRHPGVDRAGDGVGIGRPAAPAAIEFGPAMLVAALGLAVNIASALLLQSGHDHHHAADHRHGHEHGHGDHNLRAAYLHVLADALTSVLAIIALGAGWALGWIWLDPVMGLVGSGVILWWSRGLLRATTRTLLDADADPHLVDDIRRTIEADADNVVSDLHVRRVGARRLASIVSVVTHHPRPPAHYKALLGRFDSLAHVTVEVVTCSGDVCRAA
jgi:cation diffusion facilitator family transporter